MRLRAVRAYRVCRARKACGVYGVAGLQRFKVYGA